MGPTGFILVINWQKNAKKKVPLISWVISPTWVDHSCCVIDHAVGACILTWKFFTGQMIYTLLHSKSNNKCKGRYLIFVVSTVFEKNQNQRTVSSKYLKSFRIKEPHVLGIWKKSDSKNCQFWVFQKLQRTTGFQERTSKDPAVWGGYLVLVIDFWKTMVNIQ
jgi:hypothetical protein